MSYERFLLEMEALPTSDDSPDAEGAEPGHGGSPLPRNGASPLREMTSPACVAPHLWAPPEVAATCTLSPCQMLPPAAGSEKLLSLIWAVT